MNKKAIYSILSTIVAMVVLSVSLVFAIGPRVSADEGEPTIGVLDKAEYFKIGYDGVLCGLTEDGYRYANQFDELYVIIPEGVIEISGVIGYYAGEYRYQTPFSAFCAFPDGSPSYYFRSYDCGNKVTSIILPNSLERINFLSFYDTSFSSIIIPENVTLIASPVFVLYSGTYGIFDQCGCNEIIVQNEDLLTNENLAPYADIMRYEAPKYTINFDSDGGNAIDNQVVTKNGTVTEPTAPTKDGYEFKGWFIGDEEYDFATPVTENMTLTAKWEAKQVQPEIPTEENAEVNNQNNVGLIAGIVGTSAGVLIIAGIVVGVVISKRRRK